MRVCLFGVGCLVVFVGVSLVVVVVFFLGDLLQWIPTKVFARFLINITLKLY